MKNTTKNSAPVSQTVSEREKAMRMRQAYLKRKRKKKIRNTLILCCFLILVVAGGIASVLLLRSGGLVKNARTFDVAQEFASTVTDSENQRSVGIARDLCVTEGDVALENVVLQDGQSGALMDLSDKEVLYAKGIYDRIYPASITKIMTALLAIEYGNMSDTITVTQENLNLEEGSQVCGFLAGDQLTLDQLLHCLLVYSGNDAAAAIASYIGGTEEQFVDMMNQYAAKLGMTGTHFSNPHGLHQETHYTTAYDIYLMLQEAFKHSEFTDITQMSSYTAVFTRGDGSETSITLDATDYYLNGNATPPRNVTILGGKTGTTDQAGNCLALIAQNAYGNPYISIVLGAYDKSELYTEMSQLLENINPVQS